MTMHHEGHYSGTRGQNRYPASPVRLEIVEWHIEGHQF
jgi:hypothetical protein